MLVIIVITLHYLIRIGGRRNIKTTAILSMFLGPRSRLKWELLHKKEPSPEWAEIFRSSVNISYYYICLYHCEELVLKTKSLVKLYLFANTSPPLLQENVGCKVVSPRHNIPTLLGAGERENGGEGERKGREGGCLIAKWIHTPKNSFAQIALVPIKIMKREIDV